MNGWHLADLAPGLYLILLALLLRWALRRWYDAIPGAVFATFGLLVVVLFAPSLFAGRILLPGQILLHHPPFSHLPWPANTGNRLHLDLVAQITPSLALVRRALAAGHWPLWNAYAGAGMPLWGDPQSQPFAPLVLAAYPLPLEQAAVVTAGLRVLVALVFTFLFLRRQGISREPALAGALAFGLGGFVMLWLGWPIANGAAFLPVLLYAMILVEERGARRDSVLLALAVFGVVLTGQPEVALNDLLLAAAFGVARLLTRSPWERGPVLARWAVASLLALGATAPAILPAADYLPQAHRAVRMERRNVNALAADPLAPWRTPAARAKSLRQLGQRVLPVAAPNAFGNHRFGPYWGYSITNEDATAFAGNAALLAALLAAFPTAWRFRQERFFLGVAAVSLVALVRPPGFTHLVAAIPLLNRSATFQHRLTLLLGFSLAVLAACTLERWRAGELPRGRLWQGRGRTLAAALALAGIVAFAYLIAGRPSPDPNLLRLVRFGSLAVHLVVIALAAAMLWITRPSPGARRWLPGGFAAVVAFELLQIHSPANPSMPKRLYFPTLPPIAFLQQHLGADRSGAQGWVLFPNVPAVYGLADVRYTNPLKPYPMAVAMLPVLKALGQVNDELTRPEHPVYRLLGMRYQMTGPDGRLPPPWKPVFRDRAGWVWEHPRPLPRLFLPRSADVRAQERWPTPGSWRTWTEGTRDFGERTLVLETGARQRIWEAAPGDRSTLQMETLAPERLAATVRLGAPRMMASSVYQDGGWHLLVDGRPRPTVVTNGPFLGAWLPLGEHRLELLYRPRTFLPGCLLAALAGALMLLLWVPPPVAR